MSFAFIQESMLNNQLSCRWFENPWRSCDVTVVTMLHIDNLIKSEMIYYKLFRLQLECFICCKSGKAVEQTIDTLVIWDDMTLMGLHCSDNALYRYSHEFGNDLIQMVSSPKEEIWGSFAVRQDMLLSKPASYRWVETPWRPCGDVVLPCHSWFF